MKKVLFVLITLTATVFAQDPVKVTGDRVSLRAAPQTNAVLLSKAELNEELILEDNSNPDWVGVLPPERIDLWVSGEFVSNHVVEPDVLNIRSGPSLSHSIVGSAAKGDTLTVRGEAGGWLKIAPTSNTVIWISRTYVDAPRPEVTESVDVAIAVTQTVMQVSSEPVAPEVPVAVPEIVEPTVAEIMSELSAPALKKLTLNPAKAQGVKATFSGVLQPADELLYHLVDAGVTVCYVRGNAAQMKTFSGMKLQITGKTYWVEGKEFPVIVPAKIKPYATGEK